MLEPLPKHSRVRLLARGALVPPQKVPHGRRLLRIRVILINGLEAAVPDEDLQRLVLGIVELCFSFGPSFASTTVGARAFVS